MVPKPVFTKVKAYVRELTKERSAETVGKSGLGAVPLEVGRQIVDFMVRERVSEADAKDCCEYLVNHGLLARHPWGGYMVLQAKAAPEVPMNSKELVSNALKGLTQGLAQ